MHLLVVIIWELLQMWPSQKISMTGCFVSFLKRIWGQCRGVITHFTSRDIWNRYPIPDPSQYIFLKHNTRSSLSKPFPLSLKTQFLSAAVKYNTTEQIPQRPHVFLLLDTNKKTKTGGCFFHRKEVDWISVRLTFNYLIWSLTFDNLSLHRLHLL